jgi:hypothetical protein
MSGSGSGSPERKRPRLEDENQIQAPRPCCSGPPSGRYQAPAPHPAMPGIKNPPPGCGLRQHPVPGPFKAPPRGAPWKNPPPSTGLPPRDAEILHPDDPWVRAPANEHTPFKCTNPRSDGTNCNQCTPCCEWAARIYRQHELGPPPKATGTCVRGPPPPPVCIRLSEL